MSVQADIKRFDKAKEHRNQSWWDHMQEAYQYAAPQRETFFHYSPGQKKNTDLFDDTAVLGLETFASRLQSYMTPPWQKWAMVTLGSQVPEEVGEQTVEFDGQEKTVSEALELTTDIIFEYIHHSNFDSKVYEALLDLGISTGNMTCEYDHDTDQLVFKTLPMPQMYLEAGPKGDIENHWREHEIENEHIKRLWPKATLSPELEAQVENNPRRKSKIIEACLYDGMVGTESGMKPRYRYVVIDKARKAYLVEEEDESSAFFSFRSNVVPGETYGRGRVMSVLPSIKTANMIAEFELTSGALAASGVWTGVSDGVFNPYNIQIAPGIMLPVASNDSRNPSIMPLPMNFDFQFTQLKREEIHSIINRALFAEPIGSMEDPTKTATELMIRKQLDLQESGGFFSRLFTEFINKVMKRVVFLLGREGKIPRIEIDGKNYTIKHTSPLAKAMDMEDIDNLDQYVSRMMQYDPTGAMLAARVKMDEIPGYVAKRLGIDPSLVRTDAEVAELAAKAAEQAEMVDAQQGASQQNTEGSIRAVTG